MGSESEQCVDQLLIYVSELNNLIEQSKFQTTNEELSRKAREKLHESRAFIGKNLAIIPNHTLKTINDSLRKLESLVDRPKTPVKFKFSSKPAQEAVSCSITPKDVDDDNIGRHRESDVDIINSETFFGFRNQKNQLLSLSGDQVSGKDISLTELSSCQVTILGLANTVYLRDIKNCSVVVFLATRAITLTNCQDCQLKLVCQQLRINSTRSTKFQIFTSARSMLEESSGLQFSGLAFSQLGDIIEPNERCRLLSEARFDCEKNNWRSIDDFDWLHASIPSKNYSILE